MNGVDFKVLLVNGSGTDRSGKYPRSALLHVMSARPIKTRERAAFGSLRSVGACVASPFQEDTTRLGGYKPKAEALSAHRDRGQIGRAHV